MKRISGKQPSSHASEERPRSRSRGRDGAAARGGHLHVDPRGSRSPETRSRLSLSPSGDARLQKQDPSQRDQLATHAGLHRSKSISRNAPRPALRAMKSFAHGDFGNPDYRTCWLSCLFQSLWHSVVFHATFERHLAPPKFTPGPEERIFAALQRTWAEYREKA